MVRLFARVLLVDHVGSDLQVGHYFGVVHPLLHRAPYPFVFWRWLARLRGRPYFCFDGCAQYLTAPWAVSKIWVMLPRTIWLLAMSSFSVAIPSLSVLGLLTSCGAVLVNAATAYTRRSAQGSVDGMYSGARAAGCELVVLRECCYGMG